MSTNLSQKTSIPRHIAIIMDGNGRWAKNRLLPRYAGHQAGLKTVRMVVEQCVKHGVEVLTLFAFSSENWSRPPTEVSQIMDLFFHALRGELKRLQKNNVRLRIIGERNAFSPALVQRIEEVEQTTEANRNLLLQIAANYGGRWDVIQAMRRLAQQVKNAELEPNAINEAIISKALSFPDCPDPDLLIRTGGEQRVSNFLLWQLAYTELYFSEQLWPDFNIAEFEKVLTIFANRQRRFGKTPDQITLKTHNA
jgi:undecaprenyl diphosphate synthase